MISLVISSNHFYSKLYFHLVISIFSKLKYGIAYIICIRPSFVHPG